MGSLVVLVSFVSLLSVLDVMEDFLQKLWFEALPLCFCLIDF